MPANIDYFYMEAEDMDCTNAKETMSADLDGEAFDHETLRLTHHLSRCAECTELQDRLTQIHRAVRIRVAEPTPNLIPAILEGTRVPRLGRGEWVRYLLGLVAATNLVLGIREFLLTEESVDHASRHLGAFTIAVSVGLMFAAIKPARAYGLLPFAGTLLATMLIGGLIDTAQGDQALVSESAHLLDLIGLLLLWYLAGVQPSRWLQARRSLSSV